MNQPLLKPLVGLVAAAAAATLTAFTLAKGDTAMVAPLPEKKLIEFGWDVPSPAFLRDNIRTMEKKPFDGVSIRLPEEAGGGNIFLVDKWAKVTEAARREQIAILKSVPASPTLKHNFVTMYGASTLDWFSDAQWKLVEENLRYCARAGNCKGIIWDAESYGGINPWQYDKQIGREKRPFAAFYAQVRARGRQFIETLQSEFPGLSVLSLRQLSDFQDGSPFSQKLLPVRDAKATETALSEAWRGLHAAFTNGILDGLKPDTTFIDGNEDAYFYTSATDFYRFSHTMRQDALALVAPENRSRYLAHYKLGHAVSVDYTQGNWADGISFPDYLRAQAKELTPEERLRWFGQNLYYALTTSDEYAWCYNEDMNWWTGKNLPAGLEETVRETRRKFAAGEPVPYDRESRLLAAREAIKKRKPEGK